MSSYADGMRHESATPLGLTFGNSRWNIMEGGTPGEFDFLTPAKRKDAFAENFFKVKLSFALRTIGCRIVYRPHLYEVKWDCGNEAYAGASLVFPPERPGAVLRVVAPPTAYVQSQVLVYSRMPGDEKEIPYPEYSADGRTFRVGKGGLIAKIRFVIPVRHEFTVSNGWHAARAGIRSSENYHILFAYGEKDEEVDRELRTLEENLGSWEETARRWWNDYFASCPVAVPEKSFNLPGNISVEKFITRQLWHYYVCITGIVDAPHLKAAPVQVADRITFNQVYTNDNTYGILPLCVTNKAALARCHLINFIKFMITESGQMVWSMDCNGRRSSFPACCGVPAIGHALGIYIRLTGDKEILDEDAGGMTVWAKMKLYEDALHGMRDTNHDGLVEWNHIWETGDDNKVSPFFRKKGLLEWFSFYRETDGDVAQQDFYKDNICPVTAVKEQGFHLWSLGEMINMSEFRGESPAPYMRKRQNILKVMYERHWDEEGGFYCDFDVRAGKIFKAKNLDAFYFMYFERDKTRLDKLLRHLRNPEEFNLGLLPSLSMDEFDFDPQSYWAGAAWPREQCFPAVSLAKQGFAEEAFNTISRAMCCEEGPLFSENINPLTYPLTPNGHVRSMVMSSVNQSALLDICGMDVWENASLNPRAVPGVMIER